MRPMAARVNVKRGPARSAIQGAEGPKGVLIRVLSDMAEMPQMLAPQTMNRGAYRFAKTPRPKRRRNLRARRAALMTSPEHRTAMKRRKG